jgi:hypothetical protein
MSLQALRRLVHFSTCSSDYRSDSDSEEEFSEIANAFESFNNILGDRLTGMYTKQVRPWSKVRHSFQPKLTPDLV